MYDSIILPSGEEEPVFGGAGVPKGRLDFRFRHSREKDTGAVITDGIMSFKETELIKADPLGIGGKVDIGDDVIAGDVMLTPVNSSS